MDKLIIVGQQPINGVVTPSGNKNAALPVLAASLLTDEEIILENIPRIRDVETMLRLLDHLGRVSLPRPGGDAIGRRRVDTHLLALHQLGADIDVDSYYTMSATQLRGADILLDEM